MSSVGPIALGIGCDRGTPASTLAWAVVDALAACQASLTDVVAVASIDLKADEPGLQALARWQGWTIRPIQSQENLKTSEILQNKRVKILNKDTVPR